jgi:hypothetical protein
MRRTWLIGGAAAALLAAACSDSTRVQANHLDWSGAVIKVAGENPEAKGEIRGVVLDSSTFFDTHTELPVPGVTVVLWHKVIVQPTTPSDTAGTTVTPVGEVVTDANGRFLVTSIPEGDYYVVAHPPENLPYFTATTWAFASSNDSQRDATIYLPKKQVTQPGPDSGSVGTPLPPDDPPPSDSL